MTDDEAAFAAAFPETPISPAILAEDGRGPVTTLNEARDRAGQVAGSLELLATAGDGVTRVQKLVGRLRDVAVVATDRSLQPADRATLQRQVDLALSEIDTVSEQTTIEDGLLRPGPADGTRATRPVPFRAIGTATLGIAGLAVRSSDQALAATGALGVATARLERSAGALSSATSRLQDELRGLINPATTATGTPALGDDAAARSTTLMLCEQLVTNPWEAACAQSGLDVSRVKRLLNVPAG